MKYKALICDLDGTLLDTVHSIAHYLNRALTSLGYATVEDERCNYFAGDGARVLARRALASQGIYDEDRSFELYKLYKEIYDEAPLYKTATFPGLCETLAKLKSEGVLLGVVSNKPHSAVTPVIEHFYPGMFDLLVGQSDRFRTKPDPDMGEYAMSTLGVNPDEVVYLGDTGTDMKFGKALGVGKNVGVLWGFRDRAELEETGADLIISDPAELLKIFEER